MVATVTGSGSADGVAPARFGQLTFASFDDGRGQGGWQTKEAVGLTGDERKLLEATITTQLATAHPIPRFPTPEEVESLPRRLLYAPVGVEGAVAYWHSAPAGPDATNRPGNVFVHVLLDRAPGTAEPEFRPPELWRARGWLVPFGQAAVLDARLAGGPAPPWQDGPLNRSRVLEFLLDPGHWRLDVLAALLDAVAAAMSFPQRSGSVAARPGRQVVLGTASPDSAACWIAAVAELMPPRASRRFHWSTLESPSNLDVVFGQGVHLAAVPVEQLHEVPRGHVVVREDEQLTPGLYGADPHHTAADSKIPVTPWSVIAQEVLRDLPTAGRALSLQDSIGSEVDVARVDPGWALAMSVAQTPGLAEIHDDAAQLIRDAGPVELRFVPRLARIRNELVRDTLGRSLEELLSQAVAEGERGAAWTHYLERAIDDDTWLQRPEGVPLPHPSSVWRYRPVFRDRLRVRLNRLVDEYDAGSGSTVPGLLALRLADVMVRCDLHLITDDVADEQVVQAAQEAVQCCAAPALLEPATASALLDAAGPVAKATQKTVTRPALAAIVRHSPRRRGERVPLAVLRWLFPDPPDPPTAEQLRGNGPSDPLLSEVAAQVTAVVVRPSDFVLQALADALTDLPAGAAPENPAAREVERLLAGRAWRPVELRAVVPHVPRSSALQETVLRALVTLPFDADLAELVTDLGVVTAERMPDGGDGAADVLRPVVRLLALADAWWRGPESEITSRRAGRLVSIVEDLLEPLRARGLPVRSWSAQLTGSVTAAAIVTTVCWPDTAVSARLGQQLLDARDDHREAVKLLDRALSRGVVSEVEIVHAAFGGSPDYPLPDTVPAAVLDLGRAEVTAEGRRGRLLDLVLRRRAGRGEIDVNDTTERVLRLVGQLLPRGATVHETDHQLHRVRAFAQRWWSRLGVPVDVGAGGSRFLRRLTGQ